MPICFQLIDRATGSPVTLQAVDDSMWLACEGSIPTPNNQWFSHWYNTIGFALACGKTFRDCREYFKDSERLLFVIDFIEKSYKVDAWYER